MSDTFIIIGIVTLLGLIASLGIRSSAGIAATISVIEIVGLLLIIVTGWDKLGNLPALYTAESASFPSSMAVFSGALLAFFAFIGFEDMVNMAEEVKDPVRVMPRAILTVLVLSSILYLVLSLVMVAAVDIDTLKNSKVPLATVFEQTSGLSGRIISAIGILAILNGGLVQIIMAARVLYGLAKRGSLPAIFARINRHTHTPVFATINIAVIVMILALIGSLARLATLTSLLMLVVFALINAALIRIKHTTTPPEGAPNYPIIIPWLGTLTSIAFILWRLSTVVFH
jgi:APA family basic amino acid/polyamine antiporter